MKSNLPTLFFEINNSNYIFVIATCDNKKNFSIVEKIIVPNEGVEINKFTNIELVEDVIKKNIQVIESKINYIFKEVIIILDFFDYSCLNLSGFKKLNGSQVLKENISYILNSLKSVVVKNEKEKTILHIFNSKNILDETCVENLPIGLYGNFYSHELTFFLIGNNDLKNIKQVFNKCDLKIKKILLKDFIEGSHLISQNQNTDTFFKIKINKNKTQINYFEKSAFRYVEHFNFGTNIILEDIKKICSINDDIIHLILSDRIFENNNLKDDELLEEKYFTNINYRKIKKRLLMDIANARIQEIVNIILNKNINTEFCKKDIKKTFIIITDDLVSNNLKESFKFYFSQNLNCDPHLINNFKMDSLIISAANLSRYGWKKEAIPVTQVKKSLITRLFKSLFS